MTLKTHSIQFIEDPESRRRIRALIDDMKNDPHSGCAMMKYHILVLESLLECESAAIIAPTLMAIIKGGQK